MWEEEEKKPFQVPVLLSKRVSLTAWESDAEELKAAGIFLLKLSQVRKVGYKLRVSSARSEVAKSRAHLLCERRVTSNSPLPTTQCTSFIPVLALSIAQNI